MKLKPRETPRLAMRERAATDTSSAAEAGLSGAVAVIDQALAQFASRHLVPGAEVVDMLLDLRSALVFDATLRALRDELEVHYGTTACRSR